MKQQAAGKYFYATDFHLYQGKELAHCERGLAEILWNESESKHEIRLMTVSFNKPEPDRIMSAIAFTGSFETAIPGSIRPDDTICLNYHMRIGVGYASEGSKPQGGYTFRISSVENGADGKVGSIRVGIDTGSTKGEMILARAL